MIKSSKAPLFTFELLPPLKGHNIQQIFDAIDPLIDYAPSYINVTYHQEEIVYKTRKDGLAEKRVIRKRPGTVAIAASIKHRYNIPVVPHLICGGFNRHETEEALIDLNFLGIKNLLALRGDPQGGKRMFMPEEDGHEHTDQLVEQIMKMNKGIYLYDDIKEAEASDFCVGVAGYPEKHFEAPNATSDLHYLKQKVDNGASYVVTQMFFNNSHYFKFVEQCRAVGIDVPVIAGIKPLTSMNDIRLLPQTFHVEVPEELEKEVKKCKSNREVRSLGVEWATAQSKELIQNNVPGIHYYTLGRSDNIKKIVSASF